MHKLLVENAPVIICVYYQIFDRFCRNPSDATYRAAGQAGFSPYGETVLVRDVVSQEVLTILPETCHLEHGGHSPHLNNVPLIQDISTVVQSVQDGRKDLKRQIISRIIEIL